MAMDLFPRHVVDNELGLLGFGQELRVMQRGA